MSLVFLIAGALLAVAALHPFLSYPLSLWLLRRWSPRRILAGSVTGRTAICVCFYNEEAVARDKVENLLLVQSKVPGLELLAYVDAATDRTADILKEYAHRIRVVVSPQRHGKTYGMNTLVAMTDADYVVFSDANVMFAEDALPKLLEPFADPNIGCTCGHLVYTYRSNTSTASTGSLYWRFEEAVKSLESTTGSVMGADGSIFAIRRKLHVRPPPDLIDDMYVSLSILCRGARIVRVADAIAHEEAVSRSREEFRRKIRIACQAFNVHRTLRPQFANLGMLDHYKYVSHKLLRWMTAYLLLGSFLCILTGLCLTQQWVWPVMFSLGVGAGLCALWAAPPGPLSQVREILLAFIATAVGVWRSVRGERFQIWSSPASSRGSTPIMLSSRDA